MGEGQWGPGTAPLDLDVEAFLPVVFLDDADGTRVGVVGRKPVHRVDNSNGEMIPPRGWCPGGVRCWWRAMCGVIKVAL